MNEIGQKTEIKYDVDTGEYRARYSDNADFFKRLNEEHRRKESELGLKKDAGMIFVGSVPLTVVMEIKAKHGIDLTNMRSPQERKRAFQIIQQDYPLLKGTNMRIG